ncbi:MAG TPA: hypothetical protein VMF66_06290 [Candidatus Acidoferrum sp.]|nr:hypothetical protein [Candidatus Acidoferrum sp.]
MKKILISFVALLFMAVVPAFAASPAIAFNRAVPAVTAAKTKKHAVNKKAMKKNVKNTRKASKKITKKS